MIVPRLLLVFLFAIPLTACESESEILVKSTSKPLRSSECERPGTSQPVICNYKLVVRNITGNLFQGYVDPTLVRDGEESCRKLITKIKMPNDVKCLGANSYAFYLYQFEIEGEKPRDGEVVDLVNIPFTNKLRKGHIFTDDTNDDSYVPAFETMNRGNK